MPDTKSGREKKGKNKRAQLTMQLAEQDREVLNGDGAEEPPLYDASEDDLSEDDLSKDDLLADEAPEEDE